jgi:uncharacterized protein YndB with AHSA1/START domain
MSKATVERAESGDLVISPVLRAPRAALWRAWSEPDFLKCRKKRAVT